MKKIILTLMAAALMPVLAMAQCPTPATATATVTLKRKIPGLLDGDFSVSATKKVHFAGGNLMYTKSTGKWKIMEHQYDVVETLNQNVGADYASQDVVTLFGWGTSGWESDTRLADFPYYTNNNDADYGVLATKSASETLTDATTNGEKGDWGVYNSSDLGSGWRTLTNAEWGYLFNSRTNAASLRTLATVNTVHGLIIMPDGWTASTVALMVTTSNFTTNNIDLTNWGKLEEQGCVFLPAAGYRVGATVNYVGSYGFYWSSSAHSSSYAYYLSFNSGNVNPQYLSSRFLGCSVRLVQDL